MRLNDAHSNLKLTRRKFLGLSGSAACAAGLGVLAAATGSLLAPETAYATVEGDQTPLTDAEIEEMADKCSRGGTFEIGGMKRLGRGDMVNIYRMAR